MPSCDRACIFGKVQPQQITEQDPRINNAIQTLDTNGGALTPGRELIWLHLLPFGESMLLPGLYSMHSSQKQEENEDWSCRQSSLEYDSSGVIEAR